MLEKLEPKRVMHYFEEITKIPRQTGNERAISEYLKKFAIDRDLKVYQDELKNIVITKPATPGYENAPGVILQGHMDMVCVKTEDSDHDFAKDPINLVVDNGMIGADRTTLGADDGIAIAMGLAILESDEYAHPQIELFITTSEETDMSGALGFAPGVLKGEKMINIDSEEEGILTVGSAGGETIYPTYALEYEPCDMNAYRVIFSGLQGGHSGTEINSNRGNMLKVMAYFVREVMKQSDIRLSKFTSGDFDNAIPKSGEICISTAFSSDSEFLNAIKKTQDEFKNVEGKIIIECKSENKASKVWKQHITEDLLTMIEKMPTGVNTFVGDSKLVESSNNLALIREENGELYLEISVRSSNVDIMRKLTSKLTAVLDETNFKYEIGAEYPGWEYRADSDFRELAQKVYRDMYGKDFETVVIHAGLECGAVAEKYPNLDIISIGPNISGAHTPEEQMEIASAKRVFEYILKLLSELK